jgi:TrpR-related protein YerC/YecD
MSLSNDLKTPEFTELCKAFTLISSVEEARDFLSDICTEQELQSITERLQVAKRVLNKESYRSISKATGSSTTTITRVGQWLKSGSGGYRLVLERLDKHP